MVDIFHVEQVEREAVAQCASVPLITGVTAVTDTDASKIHAPLTVCRGETAEAKVQETPSCVKRGMG